MNFPGIVLCNQHQIEASAFKMLEISETDKDLKTLVLENFFLGGNSSASVDSYKSINKVIEKIPNGTDFQRFVTQKCKDQNLILKFKNQLVPWNEIGDTLGSWTAYTDFGVCCMIQPNVASIPINFTGRRTGDILAEIDITAASGKSNGMDILIDAETFNYAAVVNQAMGFKIAPYNLGNKPIVEQSSELLPLGIEAQINVKPTLIQATPDAIRRFNPQERRCYDDNEVELTFLQKQDGYSYSMENCMYNDLLIDILWECECYPIFFVKEFFQNITEKIDSCYGAGLKCAKEKIENIGEYMDEIYQKSSETYSEDEPKLGLLNLTKPALTKCLPSCQIQQNDLQFSSIPFPSRKSFFHQDYFCYAASHILQVSCNDTNRKYFLEKVQPKLCNVLESYREFFGENSTCYSWPNEYFIKYEDVDQTLNDEMVAYGKENLVLLHVFIQSPYVTKIERDVALSFTGFVANVGGLLGLFLGFSFISTIEILYWICICFNRV